MTHRPDAPTQGGSPPEQSAEALLQEIAKRDFLLQEIEIWKTKKQITNDLASKLTAPYKHQRSILQKRLDTEFPPPPQEAQAAATPPPAVSKTTTAPFVSFEPSAAPAPLTAPATPTTPASSTAPFSPFAAAEPAATTPVSPTAPASPFSSESSDVAALPNLFAKSTPAAPPHAPANFSSPLPANLSADALPLTPLSEPAPTLASALQAPTLAKEPASKANAPAPSLPLAELDDEPIRIGFVKKSKPTPAMQPAPANQASVKPPKKPRNAQDAEIPEGLEGDDDSSELGDLPTFEEKRKRSKLDDEVWKRSTWMTVLRPFLMQNWLYFVGTFLVLASGFYLLSLVWEGMSALAKGAVVWGSLMGAATSFTGVGAWLLRRYALETAGRTFWLVGSGLTGIASVAIGSLALDGQAAAAGLLLGSVGILSWNDRVLRRMHPEAAPYTTWATAAFVIAIGILPWLAALHKSSIWLLLYLGAAGLFVLLQRLPRILQTSGATATPAASESKTSGGPTAGSPEALTPSTLQKSSASQKADRFLFGGPVAGMYALLVGFGGWLLWRDLGVGAMPWWGGLLGFWGILLITGVEEGAWETLLGRLRGEERPVKKLLSAWLFGGLLLAVAGVYIARGTAFPLWLASLALLGASLLLTADFGFRIFALIASGAWLFLNVSVIEFFSPAFFLHMPLSAKVGFFFLPCLGLLWHTSEIWGEKKASGTWKAVVFALWLGLSVLLLLGGKKDSWWLLMALPIYLAGYLWMAESFKAAWAGYLGFGLVFAALAGPLRLWLGGSWFALLALLAVVLVSWGIARRLETSSQKPEIRGVLDGSIFLGLIGVLAIFAFEPQTQDLLDLRSWKPTSDMIMAFGGMIGLGVLLLWAAGATRSTQLPYLGLLVTGLSGILLAMSIPRWLGLPTRPWVGALVSGLSSFLLYEFARRGWGWQRSFAASLHIPIFVPNFRQAPEVTEAPAFPTSSLAEKRTPFLQPSTNEAASDSLWSAPLYHVSLIAISASLALAFLHPRLRLFDGFQAGISALAFVYLLRVGAERKQARFGFALFALWFLMLESLELALGFNFHFGFLAKPFGDSSELPSLLANFFNLFRSFFFLLLAAIVYKTLPAAEGEAAPNADDGFLPIHIQGDGRKALFAPGLQILPFFGLFAFFDHLNRFSFPITLVLAVFFYLLAWIFRSGFFVIVSQIALGLGISEFCALWTPWPGLRFLGVTGALLVLFGLGAILPWEREKETSPKMGGWFFPGLALPCKTSDELWGKMHRGFALICGILAAAFASLFWREVFVSNEAMMPAWVLPRGTWASLILLPLAGMYLWQAWNLSRFALSASKRVLLQGSLLLGLSLAVWGIVLAVADSGMHERFLVNRTWWKFTVDLAMLLAVLATVVQGFLALLLWRHPVMAGLMRWSRITGLPFEASVRDFLRRQHDLLNPPKDESNEPSDLDEERRQGRLRWQTIADKLRPSFRFNKKRKDASSTSKHALSSWLAFWGIFADRKEDKLPSLFQEEMIVALRTIFVGLSLAIVGILFYGKATSLSGGLPTVLLLLPGFFALFTLPSSFAMLWVVALAAGIGIGQALPLWSGGAILVAGLAVFFGRWWSLWKIGVPRFLLWSRFAQAALALTLLLFFLPLAWAASTTGRVFPFWGFSWVGVALGFTLWQEICRFMAGEETWIRPWLDGTPPPEDGEGRLLPPPPSLLWEIWWVQSRQAVALLALAAMVGSFVALYTQGIEVRWLVAFALVSALWDVFHKPRVFTMLLVSIGGSVSLYTAFASLGWIQRGPWAWGWPLAATSAVWLGLWLLVLAANLLFLRLLRPFEAASSLQNDQATPPPAPPKSLFHRHLEGWRDLSSFLERSSHATLGFLLFLLLAVWFFFAFNALGQKPSWSIKYLPTWLLFFLPGIFLLSAALSRGRLVPLPNLLLALSLWPLSLSPWLAQNTATSAPVPLLWGSLALVFGLAAYLGKRSRLREEVWLSWENEIAAASTNLQGQAKARWKGRSEGGEEFFDGFLFTQESSYFRAASASEAWFERWYDRRSFGFFAFLLGFLSFGSPLLSYLLPLLRIAPDVWLLSGLLFFFAFALLLFAGRGGFWAFLLGLVLLVESYGLASVGLRKPLFEFLELSLLGALSLFVALLFRGALFAFSKGWGSWLWFGPSYRRFGTLLAEETGFTLRESPDDREAVRVLERALRKAIGIFAVFALLFYPAHALIQGGPFGTLHHITYLTGLPLLSLLWVRSAVKRNIELHAWIGVACFFGVYAYLRGAFHLGKGGWDAWLLLLVGFVMLGFRVLWARLGGDLLERVMRRASLLLPLFAIVLGIAQGRLFEGSMPQVLLMAGVFYLTSALQLKKRWLFLPSFVALNLATLGFLTGQKVDHHLWYILPFSVSVMLLTSIFGDVMQRGHRQTLRLLAGLPVYLSGIYQVFLFSQIRDVLVLAGLSLGGIFVGIAFQIRSYLYLGMGFLILDILLNLFRIGFQDRVIGMIFLFIAGIFILGFAVFFNLKRDEIIEHMKKVNAKMADWDA